MPSTSLQDLDKKLRDAYLPLAQDFKKVAPGRSLVPTCTHRSVEEQWELFKEGRGQDEHGNWVVQDRLKVVTNCSGRPGNESHHNENPARAIDVVVTIGGKQTWDEREYFPLGALAAKYGLIWGGNFHSIKDYPHLELPKEK